MDKRRATVSILPLRLDFPISKGPYLPSNSTIFLWLQRNRANPSTPPERHKLRYPPMYALGARQVIRSHVPLEVKKDLFYRENPYDAMHNTLDTSAAIESKGDPTC